MIAVESASIVATHANSISPLAAEAVLFPVHSLYSERVFSIIVLFEVALWFDREAAACAKSLSQSSSKP